MHRANGVRVGERLLRALRPLTLRVAVGRENPGCRAAGGGV